MKHLCIKTNPSRQRQFENIVFVDTPGLADGNLQYKFDVEEVCMWLGKQVDLILVFFDPVGQALCNKTNTLIKRLMEETRTEVKFFMTKVDMFRTEQDRNKCMVQVISGLSATVPATHGLEMPLIYIEEEANTQRKLPHNQLPELCKLLEERIQFKVQDNLGRFNEHLNVIQKCIKQLTAEQQALAKQPIQ